MLFIHVTRDDKMKCMSVALKSELETRVSLADVLQQVGRERESERVERNGDTNNIYGKHNNNATIYSNHIVMCVYWC